MTVLISTIIFFLTLFPTTGFSETSRTEEFTGFVREIKNLEDETALLIEATKRHEQLLLEKMNKRGKRKEKNSAQLEKRIRDAQQRNKDLEEEKQQLQNKSDKLARRVRKHESIVREKDGIIKRLKRELSNKAALSGSRSRRDDASQEKIETLEDALGEAYYKLGTQYTKGKSYTKAIEAYQQSLQYTSERPRAYYHLGLLYKYQENDSRKALSYFNQYLKWDPEPENKERVKKLIELMK